jgi:sulfate permease, SulP family
LVDLTVAIEIGMIMAAFLFMRKMIKSSTVTMLPKESADGPDETLRLPQGVDVFEISGPFFFGAMHKFKDAMKLIEKPPKVLIIRMQQVPIIDATGIKTLEDVYMETKKRGTKMILAEVLSKQVMDELRDARLLFANGKANVTETMDQALHRAANFL